jgi:methylamine dehydrogenase accessory protein MauD
MSEILVVSVVLLWVTVIVLAIAVFALSRQIGVLLERVSPAGALTTQNALAPGEVVNEIDVRAQDGRQIHVGGRREDGRSMLLFFMSPTCEMCGALVPVVQSIAKSEGDWLDVVFASDGDDVDHEGYIRKKGLESFPYVVSMELGVQFGVSHLPHAALVSEDGILAAGGLTNTREHIESLLEAKRHGVGTIQEYLSQDEKKEASI